MKITVAIPCYRSAKTLPIVVEKIREAIRSREGNDYQIVLVNDCSPDNTYEIIKELCAEDDRITGVDLSRNWGQATARIASIPYIQGDVAVFMDDDGQHPIERIYELVDKIEEGYDLVSADFLKKKAGLFKRFTSQLAAKIYIAMGKRPEGAVSSSYFAINRMCVESLLSYTSPFPSIFGYLYQIAGRITSVQFEHQERISGKSGYNFRKRFAVWMNGFVNFSIVPLRFASLGGCVCAALGFLLGIYFIIRKLIYPNTLLGYTSQIALLLFIGGMIMLMLGLMGEYIGRMYLCISNQPQYVIRETTNVKENGNEAKDRAC